MSFIMWSGTAKDASLHARSVDQIPTAQVQLCLFFETCAICTILSKNKTDCYEQHLKEQHVVTWRKKEAERRYSSFHQE